MLSGDESSELGDTVNEGLSGRLILLGSQSELVDSDVVLGSEDGQVVGVDNRVNSVSELDWITSDTGSSSDDSERVLLDQSTLFDDEGVHLSVVLDELSLLSDLLLASLNDLLKLSLSDP